MEQITLPRIITNAFVRQHPQWVFLHGHDVQLKGCFGQASIYNLPNTIGIPVMYKFCASGARYFTDGDSSCKDYVDKAFNNILDPANTIIIPLRKMGEGCSRLKELAPRLHAYLYQRLDAIKYPNIKWDYNSNGYVS